MHTSTIHSQPAPDRTPHPNFDTKVLIDGDSTAVSESVRSRFEQRFEELQRIRELLCCFSNLKLISAFTFVPQAFDSSFDDVIVLRASSPATLLFKVKTNLSVIRGAAALNHIAEHGLIVMNQREFPDLLPLPEQSDDSMVEEKREDWQGGKPVDEHLGELKQGGRMVWLRRDTAGHAVLIVPNDKTIEYLVHVNDSATDKIARMMIGILQPHLAYYMWVPSDSLPSAVIARWQTGELSRGLSQNDYLVGIFAATNLMRIVKQRLDTEGA